LAPLVAMTYVNMCSGDWWAGGSFSNRRFDSLLPLLALGLAGFLEAARRTLAHHPQLAVSALVVPAVVWNMGALAQVRRCEADPGRGVTFARLVGGTARGGDSLAGIPRPVPAHWTWPSTDASRAACARTDERPCAWEKDSGTASSTTW